MSSKVVSSKVWESARTIWEHNPDISHDDLISQLVELYGKDAAPTSKSSISYRIKKEGWIKKKLIKSTAETDRERDKLSKTVEQIVEHGQPFDKQNNKDKSGQNKGVYRTVSDSFDDIANELIVSAETKQKKIIDTRKSFAKISKLNNSIIELGLEIANSELSADPDDDIETAKSKAQEFSKKVVLFDTLSHAANKVVATQKTLVEVEFQLYGIAPDDLQQSAQEKRIGMLKLLDGLSEEEDVRRDELNQLMLERLKEFESMEHNPDSFLNEGEPEDVGFTEIITDGEEEYFDEE
ncbi:MAG: hypothetical protein Q4P13_10700 [Psychrobacter sp.]|nr:hypothetical protein [Psychrobacter sp.]